MWFEMKQMRDRIKDEPYGPALRETFDGCNAVHEKAQIAIQAVRDDPYMNDSGKRKKTEDVIRAALGELHAASYRYRSGKAQTFGQRQDLGKPKFDDSLVAALDRQEVRAVVRAEHDAMKKKVIALELATDRQAGEALLSGKSLALTGLSDQCMKEVHEAFLRHHFADDLAKLDAYDANLTCVGSAVDLIHMDFAKTLGCDRSHHAYQAMLKDNFK